jgi:hypothetical protein
MKYVGGKSWFVILRGIKSGIFYPLLSEIGVKIIPGYALVQ